MFEETSRECSPFEPLRELFLFLLSFSFLVSRIGVFLCFFGGGESDSLSDCVSESLELTDSFRFLCFGVTGEGKSSEDEDSSSSDDEEVSESESGTSSISSYLRLFLLA
jgi:hypothetical protein